MTNHWYTTINPGSKEKRLMVIGAGLAGTSIAHSMAVRGWEVLLIEKAAVTASGASGNPFGIMAPLITHNNDPIGKFYVSGFEHSLAHLDRLQQKGFPVKFYNSGLLELSTSKINKNLEQCVPAEYIKKCDAQKASNVCGLGIRSAALYLEKCGFVSPTDICKANILAGGDNIRTIFSQEISDLSFKDGYWSVKNHCGTVIANAAVAVIANSIDITKFIQCNFIPIQPVRGQLTYLPAFGLGLKTIICYDGGYITPEINGMHYVGATYNRNNLDTEPSMSDHVENITNLQKAIGMNIDMNNLQGRVSFRASSIDRKPVIGPVPDVTAFHKEYNSLSRKGKEQAKFGKYLPGLYVTAGFGSRGLTSCSVAAELLAAMINNETLPLSDDVVKALNPARFVLKELRRIAGNNTKLKTTA